MHASNGHEVEDLEGQVQTNAYHLLDSGHGRKLERFGDVVTDRPAPQVTEAPQLPRAVWGGADTRFETRRGDGGTWVAVRPVPERWMMSVAGMRLVARCAGQGQVGLFPEQEANWAWVRERCGGSGSEPSVLNLFGYTGAMTLHAARAGARVCHVDGARRSVEWAKENAALNGLDAAPVRWITDDAMGFVRRECRRGRRYDGIILDPPSFGRGPKGEIFSITKDLSGLLGACIELLSDRPAFVVLSSHTPGWGREALPVALEPLLAARGGKVEAMNMKIVGEATELASGACARWSP